MPPLEDLDRYQRAVLWPLVGRDRQNQPLRGDPVELDVRWEDTYREVSGPQGTPIVIEAMVTVDRDVRVGSQLWQGELADWPGTGLGADDEQVMYVATRARVPDLKGRGTYRELGLTRFRDQLPSEG